MQRRGKTAAGTQRWYCPSCLSSAVRSRPDTARRHLFARFAGWVAGTQGREALAKAAGVHRATLSRRFAPCWEVRPAALAPALPVRTVVLDGIWVVPRRTVMLLAVDAERRLPIGWQLASRECRETWEAFLAQLAAAGVAPQAAVSDAQKGLLGALRTAWPQALRQRCLAHVVRQARLWLTRSPQTGAGAELLELVDGLGTVRDAAGVDCWERGFRDWRSRWDGFLWERSGSQTRRGWWYTHRKLRAVRSLLANALPELFSYVLLDGLPRTSNHVEGGVNSRLRELLRLHRGLTAAQREAFSCWFLALRQGQKPGEKPPRNAT